MVNTCNIPQPFYYQLFGYSHRFRLDKIIRLKSVLVKRPQIRKIEEQFRQLLMADAGSFISAKAAP